MDRHQFVEKLVGMRNNLNEEIVVLEKNRKNAYNKSIYRLADKLKEVEANKDSDGHSYGCLDARSIGSIGFSGAIYEEKSDIEKVTDEEIITLSAEIVELRRQAEKLSKDWSKYEGNPIVIPEEA